MVTKSSTVSSLSPSPSLCQSVNSGSSRTALLLRMSLIYKSLLPFRICNWQGVHSVCRPFSSPACFFIQQVFSLPLSISYLCFESSSSRSSSSKKNKVIKLVDITDIQKVDGSNKGQESTLSSIMKELRSCMWFGMRLYTYWFFHGVVFLNSSLVQSAVSPTRKWDGHLYSHSFNSEGTVWSIQAFFPI